MTAMKDQIAEAVATEEMEVSTKTETEKDTAPPARDMSAAIVIEAREVIGTDIEVNGATEENAAARTASAVNVTGAASGTELKDPKDPKDPKESRESKESKESKESSVTVSVVEIAEIGTVTLNATKEIVEIATVAAIDDQGEMTDTAMADMAGDQAGAEAQCVMRRPCWMNTTFYPSTRECES